MRFDHRHYVPCIRWKQGEYQALLKLSGTAKGFTTPLIEVPEIGFDFETRQPKHSVDEHLAPFAKRVWEKWGVSPCFVDITLVKSSERMADGRHPLKFIFDELRTKKCFAIPVTGLHRDKAYEAVVKEITSTDGRGLCIRVGVEEAAKSELKHSIEAILRTNGLEAGQCDLVVDLGAPNFEPVDGFAKLSVAIIQRLPDLRRWRTFALCGTSFPSSMAGIEQGQTLLRRSEWRLYKRVAKTLTAQRVRLPAFGDYGINHPEILPLDMRLLRPSATIRYTAQNSWLIVKGTNVRDNGFGQYRELCRTVISSQHYLGRGFSYGDAYIADCAGGHASTGNLTIWRQVGTNHHVEKVVRDISSFFDSGGNP